jgi:DNA-binding transcriptional MerR regulator
VEKKQQNLSIQEVSLKLNIPKHTLRFWEKEFRDILVPLRTKGGQRRYTLENMSVIKNIKKLREKKVSLGQIHAYLTKNHRSGMDDLNASRIDFLANRVAEAVKEEVYRFFDRDAEEMLKE